MTGPYGNYVDANTSGAGAFYVDRDGDEGVRTNRHASAYNAQQQGVFGLHPLMTPKYAKNVGSRDAEFRDTLARIYISLAGAGDELRAAYLQSLPGDQATQALATVLLGANSQGGSGFVDFFLTSAQESFQEIVQVDKVLADDYVAFFYGQSPPSFQYSGMLLNSMQDDQRSGFARAYQTMLRGTQLARRGALARLRYDSVIVSGTMTATSQVLSSDNELAVQFSFTFLVKEYVILNNPQFSRTTPAEYVKLAADSVIAALGPVGTVSDTRVRTIAVTPQTLASASTAGGGPTGIINTLLNAPQQLVGVAQAFFAKVNTPNVLGTIDTTPPTPPAAP